ncbi:MAG: DUF2341 domain-containing protein, partial [Verrucomicrobiota bacterium]
HGWLYYGPVDGGTDPTAWSQALSLDVVTNAVADIRTNLFGLASDTTYYYRFRATNEDHDVWAATSEHFTTTNRPWDHLEITFCGYEGADRLTNFPALVRLGSFLPGFSPNLFTNFGPEDIRFFNSNRTELLSFEIDTWNPDGISYVWVRVPELQGTNTRIHAYWGPDYGGTPAGPYGRSVWNADYLGVFHLDDTTVHTNAADPLHNGTPIGNILSFGAFGDSQRFFPGRDHRIATDILTDQTPSSPGLTYSAWIRPKENSGGADRLFDSDDGGTDWSLDIDFLVDPPQLEVFNGQGQRRSGLNIKLDTWQFVGAVFDPAMDQVRVYLDGEETVIDGLGYDSNTEPVDIGGDEGLNSYEGHLDEARIRNDARRPDWMRAMWRNGAHNNTFNCMVLNPIAEPPFSIVAHDPPLLSDIDTATFRATLFAWNRTSEVIFYYGPTDGGSAPGAWNHSIALGPRGGISADLLVSLSNLVSGTDLYYTFQATNSTTEAWSATHRLRFDPVQSISIRFCGYEGTETLTNFPALVEFGEHIPGFSYDQFRSPTGGDLRFFGPDRDRILPHETETWNRFGRSRVWVQVPELTGSNTIIHAVWDGPSITPPASVTNGMVWKPGYQAVYHLNESVTDEENTGVHLDSTTNRHHGLQRENHRRFGQIGFSQDFNTDDDFIATPVLTDQTASGPGLTYSAWIRAGKENGTFKRIFAADGSGFGWSLGLSHLPRRIEVYDGTDQVQSSFNWTVGQWHHLAAVFDPEAGEVRLYRDGTVRTNVHLGFNTIDAPVTIGGDGMGNNSSFEGRIDEARIFAGRLSSDWIKAEWQNMAAPDQFVCFEPGPTTTLKIVNRPASGISAMSATLNSSLFAIDKQAEVWLYYGPTDGGMDPAAWSNALMVGSFEDVVDDIGHVVNGLENDTLYSFTFRTTNATTHAWATPSLSFSTRSAPVVDLHLTKTVHPTNLIAGSNLTWTIVLSNRGPDLATGSLVQDPLPGVVTFLNSMPPPSNVLDNTYSYLVNDLAPGSNVAITINVAVSPAATAP